jgi:hypothetical protein
LHRSHLRLFTGIGLIPPETGESVTRNIK